MATTFASLLVDAAKKSGLMARANEAKQAAGNAAYSAAQKTVGAGNKQAQNMMQGKTAASAIGVGMGAPLAGLAKHIPGMSKATQSLGKLAHPTQLLGLPKKLLSKGMGIMGISLSVSTLLRQSQIFTGILGALFQILGGFVDLILAPFMPLFVKVIRKLAEQMPRVREYAQKVYEWLDQNVFPHIKTVATWIWDKVSGVFDFFSTKGPEASAALSTIKEWLQSTATTAWGFIKQYFEWWKTNILPEMIAFAKEAWRVASGVFNYMVDWLKKVMPHSVSIVGQVVDILINGIIKPLWQALKPILAWYADMVMTNLAWIMTFIDTKILPFLSAALDIVMPRIQALSDKFMETVAPAFTELMDAFRPMIEAIWDKLAPLVLWALPYVVDSIKWVLNIAMDVLALYFKGVAAVFRGITWLLTLPDFKAFITSLPGLILGAIIGGIGKLLGLLGSQKIDMGRFFPDIDFGFLTGIANSLQSTAEGLKAPLIEAIKRPEKDAQGNDVNITINNMSGAIIDSQTKEQLTQERLARREWELENSISQSNNYHSLLE